jgi:membrane protein DedA with SNARE-associated domain
MDSLLAPLLSYLLLYKYATVFIVVYSAAVILPLPANAMLLAVGAFSEQGYFNFWISLAVAVVANTLGDFTDYAITRRWGKVIIKKLHIDRLYFFNQLSEEMRSDAAITVFTTRFAGSLSPIANFLAGLVGVPWWTFLWCDFLGNVIEPGAAIMIGYAVGAYWNDFSGIFGIATGMIAILIIIFFLFRIHRRMTRKYTKKI